MFTSVVLEAFTRAVILSTATSPFKRSPTFQTPVTESYTPLVAT